VAIFEAAGPHGHRLVAAWAPTAAASHFPAGTGSRDPWTLYDVPAPLVVTGLEGGSTRSTVVSFYVPQRSPGGAVTDWVVALTAPVARSITVDSSSGSQIALLKNGFGTVALPEPVTSPATVLASGTPDRQLVGLVGSPASARPVRTVPRAPTLPSHFRLVGRLADVGPSSNDLGPDGLPSGHVEVAIRCSGPSSLSVSLGVFRHRVGTADCDGRTHVLVDVASVASAAPQALVVHTGTSTAYSLAVGIRS
jgi:hypothetical protein